MDMLKNTKKTVEFILKNFGFLLILFILFYNNGLKAEEQKKKFVGFIDALEGTITKGDGDNLVELKEFDQIFENETIKLDLNSSIVVAFVDNSILTLSNDAEFFIEKFDDTSQEPTFIINIPKGKVLFESGAIAKNSIIS